MQIQNETSIKITVKFNKIQINIKQNYFSVIQFYLTID